MVEIGLKKPVKETPQAQAGGAAPQFMLDADDKTFDPMNAAAHSGSIAGRQSPAAPTFILDADDKVYDAASPSMQHQEHASGHAEKPTAASASPAPSGPLGGLMPHIASAEKMCMEFQVSCPLPCRCCLSRHS